MRIKILMALCFVSVSCLCQESGDPLTKYAAYPDDTGKVSLLFAKGFEYRNTDLPRAVAFAKACYACAEKAGSKRHLAKALNLRGVLRSETGLQEEAAGDFSQALVLAVQLGDTLNQAILLNNLGNVYSSMGNPERALSFYEKSLRAARSVHDDRWVQGALLSMAELQTSIGNFRQAEGNLQTLIGWAQNRNDLEILGLCYKNMSLCRMAQNDTLAAEAYQQQALDITELTGDDIRRADVLLALGKIDLLQGKIAECGRHLQEALAIAVRNSYEEGLVLAWKTLSEYYNSTGAHKEAYRFLTMHDSAIVARNQFRAIPQPDLWKDKEAGPVTLRKEPYSLKDNIFEIMMLAAILLLLIFVLGTRRNEQKETQG